MPKPVYEKGDVTVLWNQAVHTDREVTANRPDIITLDNKFQKIFCICYEYVINLFVCIYEVRKGT
jgi:hypothetical protein